MDLLHLIENVFTLTPALTVTLTLTQELNYVFGPTKWRHFRSRVTIPFSIFKGYNFVAHSESKLELNSKKVEL